MDTKKLGSLYFNSQPVSPGFEYDSKAIPTLGDAAPGSEISWIKSGDRLVARNCLCRNISWNQLHRLGFVFGHPIKINGIPYRCRCLKDSPTEGNCAEWDDLLASVGFHDAVWQWKDIFFWCQDSSNGKTTRRVVRGGLQADYWTDRLASRMYPNVGWRPVLEELPPNPVLRESLIDAKLRVYGEEGFVVEGILQAFDNYDISMDFSGRFPYRSWAARKGNTIFIERSHITWMEIAKN